MSDSGDISAWVAAAASWVGVGVAGWFAIRSERAQKAALRHADKLHKETGEREDAAREREQVAKARNLFVAICSLPKADSRGARHAEANEKAAELYAHLGNSPRARYIVTTAMAFFSYGNEDGVDRNRASQLKEERDVVDRYLSGLDPTLEIPPEGAVRDWAKPVPPGVGASSALGHTLWRLKPDD